MLEVKDSAIKLFGKTIQLSPEEGLQSTATTTNIAADHNSSTTISSQDKKPSGGDVIETIQEDGSSNPIAEESTAPATSSEIAEDPKTLSVDKEILSQKTTKNEDSNEASDSQEKTLKKPDKILPCPRCNSMDTKFCYYNNYNVSQPRHFCKNCQRYWTAGGTTRNVPVGSGRRKNKSSAAAASHYCQLMISETLQAARTQTINGIHHPTFKPNGTVPTSDVPLCESMASGLNLEEKSQNYVKNSFHGAEQSIPDSCGRGGNGGDQLGGSSRPSSASNSTDKGSSAGLQNFNGFPSQVPCFPGPPWPCPWNSGQWRPPMPPPAFVPSGFPVSFYPEPAYWSCTTPSPWNMPWISAQPSSADLSALSSSPNSQTLGKHSRDGDMLKTSNTEKEDKDLEGIVWIPKTLRIDKPSEAAKCSNWWTLEINNKIDSNGDSLFKAFQQRGDEKNRTAGTSLVLQANPAALSRSLNFHEST